MKFTNPTLSQALLKAILLSVLICSLCRAASSYSQIPKIDRTTTPEKFDYINPFIGTGGVGASLVALSPYAQVPFGMVRVNPDTISLNFTQFNLTFGYYYYDQHIRVISHTHMVGAGVLDFGNIGFMPISSTPNEKMLKNYEYKSAYNHEEEQAFPGYYAVNLTDHEIQVELTATAHAAVHRYTYYEEPESKVVLIDMSSAIAENTQAILDTNAQISDDQTTVTGWAFNSNTFSGRFGGVKIYFVAQFSHKFGSFGMWDGKKLHENQTSVSGPGSLAYVGDFEGGNQIEVYVGISFISIDQARRNLEVEIFNAKLDFSGVLNTAIDLWDEALSPITIDSRSTEHFTVFYTAFYRALLAPTNYTEVGGIYLGFDNQTHEVEINPSTGQNYTYMSDLSIWDTFRTQFPLLGIITPSIIQDVAWSLLKMYEQGGDLPRWPFINGYTSSMIGQHADIVVADAFLKGIITNDVAAQLYKGMYQGATQNQTHAGRDVDDWWKLGYIPVDHVAQGCSWTLELAYDDFAIAQVAKMLGNDEDYEKFMNSSKNYKNVWHEESQFMCPKTTEGKWDCPPLYINIYDPRYEEGDGWQWRWFVPHDPQGFIALFKSKEYFVEELTKFFELSNFDEINAVANPYYWQGNEVDIFAPYMFNFVQRSDLTAKYLRRIMKKKYTTAPNGIDGNDDYGTMSSWYVFSAMGFYPQSGTLNYIVGSPLFDKITIFRQPKPLETKPSTLTIMLQNYVDESFIYVEKIAINGFVAEDKYIITEDMLSGDTILEFYMTNQPTNEEVQIEI